ncbi:DnaD domain protein [Bacillus sp. RO2]|uniref:replication protein n=1 Tax=Bacillus sp. RO2 TaxID=2723913 RepID=UPI00145CF6ED|nr:replication protein [Bacillus sp. RO2]NMH72809.1 DnaD domain protein [Bacillus sp. RO2]
MANVQPENGFTRIAHEILEQTMKIKLSPTQHKIILAVWRYTYGFNRKDHDMSLSFLSEATDVHKQRIKPELDKLIDRQILIITQENTARKSRRISFNKDYDKWDKPESAKMLTVSESAYSRVSETDDSRVSRTAYQERKNLKKNIKKNNKEEGSILEKIIGLLQISGLVPPRKINLFLREDIEDVIENFGFETPIEIIEAAIKDAARGNGETWKFVYNKLNNWRKSGVKTLADLDHLQENKKAQHKASNVDYGSLAKEFENE